MALAYSNKRYGVEDKEKWVEADVTFDSSYPTGGETVTPSAVGLRNIVRVVRVFEVYPDGSTSAATDTDGKDAVPVITTTSVKLALYTNGAQVANTSDQSAVVKRFRFIGSS